MTGAAVYRAITDGIVPVACPSCATRFDGSQTPAGVPWRCPRCHASVARTAAATVVAPLPEPASTMPTVAMAVAAAPIGATPAMPAAANAVDPIHAPIAPTAPPTAPLAPDPAMPGAIRGLAIAAVALATLDLLIGVVLAILAFAELAGGSALMWAGVLVCQVGFLGEFALLLAGGVLLLRGDARGRTLALVHALSVIPVFLAGTIGIRIVESLDAMREARERPAMWLMAAPFAGIFAVVLLLMLNRPAVRAWAHRRRLARAQVEPATLPPERRDGLPVSELALWSAVIAWMPFPPLLAQMTACGLGIAGLVVTRRGRHGGRGYAVYGLALSGLALASVLAAFIAFLCWKKQG